MTQRSAEPIVLCCLQGELAPQELGRDLQRLVDLPDPAQRDFWKILVVYLRPEIDDEGQAAIVQYCGEHQLTFEQVSPAIRAVRLLFHAVARSAVSVSDFEGDVLALLPGDDGPLVAALVIPWLEDILPKLREEVILRSIADHGNVVNEVRWRVDRVTSSDRGLAIGTSLGVMTFSYMEGEAKRRISLQMMPEQLDAVRKAVDEMLS